MDGGNELEGDEETARRKFYSTLSPKQILSFEKECEKMRFLGFGKTPQEWEAFLKSILLAQNPEDLTTLKGQAAEMLQNFSTAFVPTCTKEGLLEHSDKLREKLVDRIRLYDRLKEKGPYYGGKKQ